MGERLLFSTVAVEEGKTCQELDVGAVGGIALGQNGDAAGDGTAGQVDQLLHGKQAPAGGDHVVDEEDAFAADQIRIIAAQV